MSRLPTVLKGLIHYIGIPLFGLWLLWVLLRATGLTINLTPSMPIGLYRREPLDTLRHGQTVEVCLPAKIAAIGRKRAYISASHRTCPDGSESVIKEVIATPADAVTVTPEMIQVTNAQGGLTVYYAPSAVKDRQGRLMERSIGFGPQVRGIWLYGNNDSQHSWDSRYYGPIQLADIRSAIRPIWTIHHRHTTVRPLSSSSPAWPANVWPDPDNPTEPDAFQLMVIQAAQSEQRAQQCMKQMKAFRNPHPIPTNAQGVLS